MFYHDTQGKKHGLLEIKLSFWEKKTCKEFVNICSYPSSIGLLSFSVSLGTVRRRKLTVNSIEGVQSCGAENKRWPRKRRKSKGKKHVKQAMTVRNKHNSFWYVNVEGQKLSDIKQYNTLHNKNISKISNWNVMWKLERA